MSGKDVNCSKIKLIFKMAKIILGSADFVV